MVTGARKRIFLMALIVSLASILMTSTAFARISISSGELFRYYGGSSVSIGLGEPPYEYRYYRRGPSVYIYVPYYGYPPGYYDQYYNYRYFSPYRDYRWGYRDSRGPWSYPHYYTFP
ncbi:MAG: hypothetical protein ABFD46_12145 [Armatimonadota bacterium]